MTQPIRWAARLEHVQDITLLGQANLQFWTDQLQSEQLVPVDRDGHAQLMIVAAASRYLGIRFQELSFSVLVQLRDSEDQGVAEAAFLIQAYNSRRFFAWCERALFCTPYLPGNVQVTLAPPEVRLVTPEGKLFAAQMRGNGPPLNRARVGDDRWQGRVYLPSGGNLRRPRRRYFYACLAGTTRQYASVDRQVELAIRPSAASRLPGALIESEFCVTQWLVRTDATHAKSKTYSQM